VRDVLAKLRPRPLPREVIPDAVGVTETPMKFADVVVPRGDLDKNKPSYAAMAGTEGYGQLEMFYL
jgi:hypothetical protein